MSKILVCFLSKAVLFLSISSAAVASGGVIYIKGGISEPSCIVNGGDNIRCRSLADNALSINQFSNKSVVERAEILNSNLVKIESISTLKDVNGKPFSVLVYK